MAKACVNTNNIISVKNIICTLDQAHVLFPAAAGSAIS